MDKYPEYNENIFEGQLTLWKDEYKNLKKDNFSHIKFEFNKKFTQEELKKNILDNLSLQNENTNDYLFYRKLELSANNFNLISILQNEDELKKEVFMSNINNGIKIFVEKKEYEKENGKVKIF